MARREFKPEGSQIFTGDRIGMSASATLDGGDAQGDRAQAVQGVQVAQASGAPAPAPAGSISQAAGPVTITRAGGATVQGSAGTPVYAGDLVETGEGGGLRIAFSDGSTVGLGAGGRLEIDRYVFDARGETGAMQVDFIRGIFSFASGQIARFGDDQMSLTTPVATIGVRGTTGGGIAGPEGQENLVFLFADADGAWGSVSVRTNTGQTLLNNPLEGVSVTSAFAPPSSATQFSAETFRQRFAEIAAFLADELAVTESVLPTETDGNSDEETIPNQDGAPEEPGPAETAPPDDEPLRDGRLDDGPVDSAVLPPLAPNDSGLLIQTVLASGDDATTGNPPEGPLSIDLTFSRIALAGLDLASLPFVPASSGTGVSQPPGFGAIDVALGPDRAPGLTTSQNDPGGLDNAIAEARSGESSIGAAEPPETPAGGASLPSADDPSGIALSGSTVVENTVDAQIGLLSASNQLGEAAPFFTLSGPDASSFDLSGASLFFRGSPDFEAQQSYFVKIISAPGGGPALARDFTIEVLDMNEAPVLSASLDEQAARQDSPFGLVVPESLFTDPEGEGVSLSVMGLPDGLTFDPVTRLITGVPTGSAVGQSTITITATDPAGLTASTSFDLSVDDAGTIALAGDKQSNTLTGTTGAEVLRGLGGDDTLIGGGGADRLFGGAGDDLLIVADDGFHSAKGGGGNDTLQYAQPVDFIALLDGSAKSRLAGIETLDISADGGKSVIALSPGVFKTLTILTDDADTVGLASDPNLPGSWIQTAAGSGIFEFILDEGGNVASTITVKGGGSVEGPNGEVLLQDVGAEFSEGGVFRIDSPLDWAGLAQAAFGENAAMLMGMGPGSKVLILYENETNPPPVDGASLDDQLFQALAAGDGQALVAIQDNDSPLFYLSRVTLSGEALTIETFAEADAEGNGILKPLEFESGSPAEFFVQTFLAMAPFEPGGTVFDPFPENPGPGWTDDMPGAGGGRESPPGLAIAPDLQHAPGRAGGMKPDNAPLGEAAIPGGAGGLARHPAPDNPGNSDDDGADAFMDFLLTGSLRFIGGEAFSGSGGTEVRIDTTFNRLEIDGDGNGEGDLSLSPVNLAATEETSAAAGIGV